jgi:hypothetical protein
MSEKPKSLNAVGAAFILVAAGMISVTAQTQPATIAPSINTVTSVTTEIGPKRAKVAEPAAIAAESPVSDTAPVARTDDGRTKLVATDPAAPRTTPASETRSAAPASTDGWHFQFTPYGWLAGTSGTLGIGNLTAKVDSSVSDTSVHINAVFMAAFEANKNKFTILTDLQYSNLGTKRATPGPGYSAVETATKTFILDPEVGYRFAENKDKGRFVEVLGGLRYWHVTEELNFSAGILAARSASASRDWVDAIVGIRGKAALSKLFFVSGKADIGGGGSKFTWQIFGALGINMGKHFALIAGYRDLEVNKSKANDFTFDLSLHGPLIGLGIKF